MTTRLTDWVHKELRLSAKQVSNEHVLNAVTVSRSSHSINTEQPSRSSAFLYGSGLHNSSIAEVGVSLEIISVQRSLTY